jgi:serine/threonine protein kinase
VSYAARDTKTGEKVFFKLYQSPSVRVPWYKPFIRHQQEMKERIESGPCRQFCYRFLGGFEHDRKYHQVFEFLDRSHSLAQILDKIQRNSGAVQWEQRELMAKVLVAGINQLHQARIVHADLKPENVMLIEDASIGMKYRLKIIDMDFSIFTDRKAPWDGFEGYFGTPGYMSPEHMTRKVPLPASDVFTLGLMLYQLLAQGHPYVFADAEKYLPAYRAHSAARPKLLGTPKAPAKADVIAEALFRCLHPEPSQRPKAADLHKALTGEVIALPVPPPPPPVRVPPPAPAVPTPPTTTRRVALVSADGIELSVGARLVFGRVVLAKFGDAAKYAANEQFILDRVGDQWFVEPCPGTTNDTMHNGALLVGRKNLEVGDTIALGKVASGRTVLELTVRAG